MRIGTKSLLFGAHCFFIHPILVFIAWTKLYGFPKHLALWLCFLVHDWGYWQRPDLDGPEGERHPELGANIVRFFFGDLWGDFCLYHSRRYAKLHGKGISQLCTADKLATVLMPAWLYVPMTSLTGEIKSYMVPDAALESEEYLALVKCITNPYEWFAALKIYMGGVVAKTKDSALSIEDLQVDSYVAEYGEHNRDEIIDALIRWEDPKCRGNMSQDSFVSFSILRR